MEKHISLVGVLNIAYRSIVFVGAAVLMALTKWIEYLLELLIRRGFIHTNEFPVELLDIIPTIIVVVAAVMMLVSAVAIVGGIGVLKKKEWGRITVLVISFFNLIRIPLGTAVGVYSLWVLLNDETIKSFRVTPTLDK